MAHQSNLISKDIHTYLNEHEKKELLRFITCGSVDDGKSTLIGRLLHDSKMIYEDQLSSLKSDSKKVGTVKDSIDFALLVDGLASEREQGITIDVAYRYFSTNKRKFIIADTPGHEQYTRNMATGASTANLAIILIDARKGVLTQTKRHSFIVDLLGIQHIVVAINKMDLMDFSEEIFEKIKNNYLEFAKELNIKDIRFIPISALNGDNIVDKSQNMSWYKDKPLMEILESIEIVNDLNFNYFSMPIQYVNRPNLNFRGYTGTISTGVIKKGDEIKILPSNKKSIVESIVTYDGELNEAFIGQAITLTLKDEIDISRGDILTTKELNISDLLLVNIVWMSEESLHLNSNYDIKFYTKVVNGFISEIEFKKDVNTLEEIKTDTLVLNEIAKCKLSLNSPIVYEEYTQNKTLGSFIIIDRLTNNTVGVGMVIGKVDSKKEHNYSDFELELNALVRKHFPHWGAKDLLAQIGN